MVVYTGGFSPRDSPQTRCATSRQASLVPGVPNAVIIWALIGAAAVFVLTRTTFGRSVYAIGNRERAAYLSGVEHAPRRLDRLRRLGRA